MNRVKIKSSLARGLDEEQRGKAASVLWPVLAILIGHFMVDVLSAVVPSLLGVIEKQFFFNEFTSALLFGIGSIFSGVSQPIFAWLSDRWNTRLFGGGGILLGGVGIGLIGFSPTPVVVFFMYAIGMAGVGMFHPIAASTIGNLAGSHKNIAISWFFVFGMAGGFSGSLLGPFLGAGEHGSLTKLAFLFIPAVLIGVMLHGLIRKINHRASRNQQASGTPAGDPCRSGQNKPYDWVSIGLLYGASILRFTVNLSLNYLLLRWLQEHFAETHPSWSATQVADQASPVIGQYYAAIMLGMAAGGLTAGSVIKVGSEKRPMILVPIFFAPVVGIVGLCSPGPLAMGACFLSGAGFASMVPVSISLAQRLMPRHTSLASGLMLGGAWSVASVGPVLAQWVYFHFGLVIAFASVGCLLAIAGMISIGLNHQSIREW